MIVLSLTNVHYTWSRSIQNDSSRIQIDTTRKELLKALYGCDSLNTLLSDNLKKATLKEKAQADQNLFLAKQLYEKDEVCKVEEKKAVKKQKKKGGKVTLILATLAFVTGLII